MTLHELLIAPFAEHAFMRRALVACVALGLAYGPVGCFLVIRRMTLIGDAMSHALLPGAAAGFLLAGLSTAAMGAGAFVSGLAAALAAVWLGRRPGGREDATFAAMFALALAAGVMMVSLGGSPVDLTHILFGSVLAVDDAGLFLAAGACTLTVIALAATWRALVLDCLDPGLLPARGFGRDVWRLAFMTIVVANLVAGYQAIGAMLAVGLMVVPAAAARHWARTLAPLTVIAAVIAGGGAAAGLLASYHLDLPTGPTILLSVGAVWAVSVVAGREGGLIRWRRRHLAG